MGMIRESKPVALDHHLALHVAVAIVPLFSGRAGFMPYVHLHCILKGLVIGSVH